MSKVAGNAVTLIAGSVLAADAAAALSIIFLYAAVVVLGRKFTGHRALRP